ncbi:MAG: glycosyltransferase family 2 protein [Oceanospirillaceae bacterium]|nr:glycosyltransferase family 2 protein [Oceanospirillaceae bacterium]
METVSVIMPFKDGHHFVYQALDSVALQRGFDIEVVIVDDMSKIPLDLSSIRFPHRIKLIRNENPERCGAGSARGAALEAASGRFIAFLDCDDIWAEGKLEYQINEMIKNDWAMSFGAYSSFNGESISQEGCVIRDLYVPRGKVNFSGFLGKRFTVGCLTVVYDRSKLLDPKPSDLKRRNDYHMWAQLALQGDPENLNWGILPKCLGYYRVQDESLSSSKRKSILSQWEFLRKIDMPVWRRVGFFIEYIFRTSFRRFLHG